MDHFLQKSPIINDSFAERDLQLERETFLRDASKYSYLHGSFSAKEPYIMALLQKETYNIRERHFCVMHLNIHACVVRLNIYMTYKRGPMINGSFAERDLQLKTDTFLYIYIHVYMCFVGVYEMASTGEFDATNPEEWLPQVCVARTVTHCYTLPCTLQHTATTRCNTLPHAL